MADVVTAPDAATATIVAVCAPDRMAETSTALRRVRDCSAVRTLLISLGSDPQPPIETGDDAIVIQQLQPKYLNNAVAALRLSSLPSIAWWRGGEVNLLLDLAVLVDRLVLDAVDPRQSWALVPQLVSSTLVGDLRWTALTRWRGLIAQFFDLPGIRAAIGSFTRLEVGGADVHSARLFAGGISSRLPEGNTLDVQISSSAQGVDLDMVTLLGRDHRLALQRLPSSECIRMSVETRGRAVSRVVPLGSASIESLLAQELRMRARDVAFEEAVQASAGLS